MSGAMIGYARCSTGAQGLTRQRQRLAELGVAPDRIDLGHGLAGTNRKRPGPGQALAAVREGDTLVVPKLAGLPGPCPAPAPSATTSPPAGIRLSRGRQLCGPTEPMGKMFFNILAIFTEAGLVRMRTREGMAVAPARASSADANPGCRPGNRPACGACAPLAAIRPPILLSCSPCRGPRCTALQRTPAAQTR